MEKIRTNPKYVIDITGRDLLLLKELGGGIILKLTKNEVFLTYEGVIGS